MNEANDTSPGKRPGRPRANQPRLTRDAILRAALDLVDAEGIDGLSMRRLGAALDVDPMSLYHHVPSKSALVSGLVERTFSEMARPDSRGPWQARVRAWAQGYRELALRHPGLALQIVADAAAVSTAMLSISEPLYEALADAGQPPLRVVQSAGAVVDYVNGFVLAEASRLTRSDDDALSSHLRARAGADTPTLTRIHEALSADAGDLGFDASFDAGIDFIVAGVAALAGP